MIDQSIYKKKQRGVQNKIFYYKLFNEKSYALRYGHFVFKRQSF